jgi:hypothetical protein
MNHARESSRRLSDLLRSEHGALADFLVALAEFDRQRLWLQLGFANLFDFLHRELSLSRGSAHYRKVAARLVQTFPEVVEPLRSGKLCISVVLELAKVITPENRADVLPKFFGLSKQEAKAVAVEIRPAEVVPRKEMVTTLPLASRTPDALVQPVELEEARPALGVAPQPLLQSEPLTPELRRLHMTVSKQFLDKLEAARKGQGHAQPGATAEKVLEAALDLLLAAQAERRAEVKTPQQNPRPTRNPCHVPAAVKRAVWARDEGKCQWRLDSGGICGSTLRLEIDHIRPLARGGRSTVDNCRLACRFHNQLAARQVYGDDWMDRFTNANAVSAPIAREPTATWSYGEAAAALFLSRRGARCDEVPAGAPRTEQARARCASAPFSLERPPPRTCSEEQSAAPAGGTYDAGRAFSLAIHASIRASSTSSGTAPAPRTASWNRRTSKAVPSAWVARFRSSRICNSPTL